MKHMGHVPVADWFWHGTPLKFWTEVPIPFIKCLQVPFAILFKTESSV